ncbi:Hypothetical protein PBC10988_8700 [Planctomycetales bacterium 10988]|nr:Hypothetical protein PBC10988_8700 [Planctomycetales bacterium 10988]
MSLLPTLKKSTGHRTKTTRPVSPRTKRQTIAWVVHTFDVGGLERCVAHLANQIDRKRFRPLIVCLNQSGTATPWLEQEDVPVLSLQKQPGNDLKVVRSLAEVLSDYEVNLVHSHNWGTLLETSLARRWAGVSAHLHAEHGLELKDLQLPRMRKFARDRVTSWLYRQVDLCVTVSDPISERVMRLGLKPSKLELVPNGVSDMRTEEAVSQRASIRRQLKLSDNTYLIGSVGRLAEVKNFPTFLRAIAAMRAAGDPVAGLLVGDGPELSTLKGLADKLGILRHMYFVGRQNDAAPWLAAMDLYLNCSHSEGMSLSILEALSAGLPAVVSPVGENPTLVGGETPAGIVLNETTPESIQSACHCLIEDPVRRLNAAVQARDRYEKHYASRQMVLRYEKLYQKLTASRWSLFQK